MRDQVRSWDGVYGGSGSLWGEKPDRVLVDYAELVPEGKVLDLGIGEGRNGLFLARLGYEVEGLDSSRTAVERCIKRAREAGLKLHVRVEDLRKLNIPVGTYSLIIAAWVLNFFPEKEAKGIIQMMKEGLKKGGLLYVGVFSPEDPGYERSREKLKLVSGNTFYSPHGDTYIHYFTNNEIRSLFPEFKIVSFVQGFDLDLIHGEPHYHGFITYLGQRSP